MTVNLKTNLVTFPLRLDTPECPLAQKLYQQKVKVSCVHPLSQLPSPYPKQITTMQNELSLAQRGVTRWLPNDVLPQTNPFLQKIIKECTTGIRNAKDALAISTDHKHVLLQQVPNADGPTCIAMLASDRGENLGEWDPLFKDQMRDTDDMINLTLNAGFAPIVHSLNELGSKEEKAKFLADRLQKNGDGILAIDHPVWKGHYICLSSVSIEANLAVVRDPAEGRMLSLPLSDLLEWSIHENDFIQFGERVSESTFKNAYQTVKQKIEAFKFELNKISSTTLSDEDYFTLQEKFRSLVKSYQHVIVHFNHLKNKFPEDEFLKQQGQRLIKVLDVLLEGLEKNLGKDKMQLIKKNLGKEQKQHPNLGLYELFKQLINKLFHLLRTYTGFLNN